MHSHESLHSHQWNHEEAEAHTLYNDDVSGGKGRGKGCNEVVIKRGAGGLRVSTGTKTKCADGGSGASPTGEDGGVVKARVRSVSMHDEKHKNEQEEWKPSKRKFPRLDSDMYSGIGKHHGKRGAHTRIHNLDHHLWKAPMPHPISRKLELYPAEFSDSTQLYPLYDSQDEDDGAREVMSKMEMRDPISDGECVPMQNWQTTFHPSCNDVHELDLERGHDNREGSDLNLFGTGGYWRNAWRVDLWDGHDRDGKKGVGMKRDTVVLKTLRYVLSPVLIEFSLFCPIVCLFFR